MSNKSMSIASNVFGYEAAVSGFSNVSDTDRVISELISKVETIESPVARFFACIDQSVDLLISSIGYNKTLLMIQDLHRKQVINLSDAHYICDKLSARYQSDLAGKYKDFHSWLSNN